MTDRNLCQQFFAKGLTSQGWSLSCAVRYEPLRGSAVRLLGVSSLNSGRAHARPFFFALGRAHARPFFFALGRAHARPFFFALGRAHAQPFFFALALAHERPF